MAELEGFICPLCMQGLPGVPQLEEHMREQHDESTKGKMKANFKQFFGKAKTSLSNKLEESISEGAAAVATGRGGVANTGTDEEIIEDVPVTNVSGIDPALWPTQEQGHERDFMGAFRGIRDVKVQRMAVETNRVLVRLEKLLKLLKKEHTLTPKQLKTLEQEIVPWKKDSDQKRCMKCYKEFNVRRRRHHCRLCGDVICKNCSSFYPFTEAYQLMINSPDYESILPSHGARPQQSKKTKLKKLLKDNDEEDEDTCDELRVCGHCEELLVRRLARMQSEKKKVISAMYDKMVALMVECDGLKPSFLEMAQSLYNGEFHHNLQTATDKRQFLIVRYEAIDKLSKQILNLTVDEGAQPTPANTKLQKSIRLFASTYLQDNLLSLPALPTKIQLRKIRETKEKEAEELRLSLIRQKEEQRIIQEEVAAAAMASKKDKDTKNDSIGIMDKLDNTIKDTLGVSFKLGPKESNNSSSSVGWTAAPAISSTLDDEFDPFELQRQQLLSYIEQAREAKKFDEMEALQMSLAEIESMMRNDESVTFN